MMMMSVIVIIGDHVARMFEHHPGAMQYFDSKPNWRISDLSHGVLPLPYLLIPRLL